MPKKYHNRSLTRSRSRSPVRKNKSSYKRTPVHRKKYYNYSDSESDSDDSDSQSDSGSESDYTSTESSDSEDEYDRRRSKGKRESYNRNVKRDSRDKKNNKKNSRSPSRSPSPVRGKNRESRESRENKRRDRENARNDKKNHESDSEHNEDHSEDDHNDNKLKNSSQDDERNVHENDKTSNKQTAKKGRPSRKADDTLSRINDDEDDEKETKGAPKYRVVSFNGEELAVRKLYTSNIGPKNAAQKAFNRMCDKLNEKMEISVEKMGDKSGKVMTYLFMKQELDPPVEKEIGGKKVVYRHKTVSC